MNRTQFHAVNKLLRDIGLGFNLYLRLKPHISTNHRRRGGLDLALRAARKLVGLLEQIEADETRR